MAPAATAALASLGDRFGEEVDPPPIEVDEFLKGEFILGTAWEVPDPGRAIFLDAWLLVEGIMDR